MPRLPILTTLRGYQSSWIGPDVLAGLTLVAIAVPEQMATARLANMPAITGLYAFLAGSVMFALLGSDRHMSVGADSTIAPVLAAGVAGIAAVGALRYQHLVTFLALVVGAVVIAAGLLRLGWIADFLSSPVVTGVLAGIAVEITVRQLPAVLGLPGRGTTTIGRIQAVIDERTRINGWAVAIAAGVLFAALATERIDRRVPGALIGLALSIALVKIFDLRSHGLMVVGSTRGGLPSVAVPSVHLDDLRRLVGPTLVVAFLCLIQSSTTVRLGAARRDEDESFNRDLIAVGAGSVVAGLTGAFAVNASPPRTAVVAGAGGRSQVAGLTAATVVVAVTLFFTGLLRDLPQAALGGVLIYVATRIFHGRELRQVWAFDRVEFALAAVTVVVVGVVGIEQGVALSILLALAQRTRLTARPRDVVLGREPGTDHWIPPDIGRPTEQVPGVVVYLLYAPVWYGNADHVTGRMRHLVRTSDPPARAFVLDSDGISDVDYTGARALDELARELAQAGVQVGVARSSHLVHHYLKHGGLLGRIGSDHLFATVEDAVRALAPPPPPGR